MQVWIVFGYFGSQHWIEAVCATRERAESILDQLWSERDSEKTPEHAKRVAKFWTEEVDVLE
jgi:hypothetical protein